LKVTGCCPGQIFIFSPEHDFQIAIDYTIHKLAGIRKSQRLTILIVWTHWIEFNWKMNRCKAIRYLIVLSNAWRSLVFIVQQITGRLSGIWLVNGGSFLILVGPWGLVLDSYWLLHVISRRCRQTGVLQHPSAVFVMDWFWFGYFLSWHRNVTCSRSCRVIAGTKLILSSLGHRFSHFVALWAGS